MDGLTDRFLHRPCARILIPLLVRLRVTPNLVTLGGFALGLVAAWQFSHASPRSASLGLLLYLTAAVADHADGELARLTGNESSLGRWLDVSVDTVTNMLVVLAMAATASTFGSPFVFLLGGVAAVGILLSSLFVNFLLPPMDPSRPISRGIFQLGNRDAFYLTLLSFIVLLRKAQALLPILLWVVALGSQGYWLTCLGYWIAVDGRPSRPSVDAPTSTP